MYIYVCVYMYICVCVYIYICMYVYMCVCMCRYMFIYIYICVYICVCVCIYIYVYICMCVCVCIFYVFFFCNKFSIDFIYGPHNVFGKSLKNASSVQVMMFRFLFLGISRRIWRFRRGGLNINFAVKNFILYIWSNLINLYTCTYHIFCCCLLSYNVLIW